MLTYALENSTINNYTGDWLYSYAPISQLYIYQFVIIFLAYLFSAFAIYLLLVNNCSQNVKGDLSDGNRILFVISHPDDECMFFGPSILKLSNTAKRKVYLLCLSTGDYYKEGSIRQKELWDSCRLLGIPVSHILLYKLSLLPDDPNVEWDESTICKLISQFVYQYGCDRVVTFDKFGVSYHANHRSVFYALASLVLSNSLPSNCAVYCLNSVNLVRKYTSIFDAFFVWFYSDHYILSWNESKQIEKAMIAHRSQYVWFRKLYMHFSVYVFFNTFSRLTSSDAQLDLDLRCFE